MKNETGSLRRGIARGGEAWFLNDRSLHGGDIVELCCSGGWITGRFEHDVGTGGAPTFFFSIELGEGRVAQMSISLPEGALMRLA
ncbi:hypothetical protein [Sandaracinus amylolyticus]|uniref:DUF5348 domain-containing protein n=1 Tax=Sandaracinus amylolyticus TaxID=927083 RepID=A0A0F6WAN8_9BACT|nr:hypothetical protein [Sandaracinus amylolyticus]AKF11686.1 hypothetical protein DB32_008835 [Sandaracinus amylolyticus]